MLPPAPSALLPAAAASWAAGGHLSVTSITERGPAERGARHLLQKPMVAGPFLLSQDPRFVEWETQGGKNSSQTARDWQRSSGEFPQSVPAAKVASAAADLSAVSAAALLPAFDAIRAGEGRGSASHGPAQQLSPWSSTRPAEVRLVATPSSPRSRSR